MKRLILFALFSAGFLGGAFAQSPQIVNYNQVETEVCFNTYEIIVEDVAVYAPNIASIVPQSANTSTGDYGTTSITYSSDGDTAYFDVFYNGFQIPSGPDMVTISFNAGGQGSNTVDINITINPEPTVNFDQSNLDYFCPTDAPFDISAYGTPAGGVFSFNAPGNEANNLVSPGGIVDPGGMPQGYSETSILYTYTDGNGCSANGYYDWYNYVLTPPSFTATPTDATTCAAADGSLIVTPDGNTANYDISLQNGDSISTGNLQSGTLANLAPGLYVITVADDSGCYAAENYSIEAGDLSVSGIITDVSCPGLSDGNIDITVNTSNNYSSYWLHGAFYEDLNNFPAGEYTFIVTDENGCEVAKTFEIGETLLSFGNTYAYSYDCNDPILYPAELYIEPEYENGPITYNVTTGGNGTMVNDSTYTDLLPGDYPITLTDANGCSIDTVVSVDVYTFFDAYLEELTPSDCGGSNGSIDISTWISQADSLGATYWSNGATTEDLSGLAPGTYTYTMEHVSNPVCNFELEVELPAAKPLKNDICMVTVDSITSTNLVVWEREETTGIDHYNIYRETNNANQFVKIDEVLSSEETMFNDVWASPLQKSWGYKISAVNTCGVESSLSSAHRTIHLRRNIIGADVELNWNKYQGFSYTDHDIWRFTATNGWELIYTVPFGQTSYTDTPPTMTGLDYAIEVDPGYVCQSTKATSHNASRSNRSSGIFNPGEGTGASNNSIVENEMFNVQLFPNPANNTSFLSFDASQKYVVRVFNMSGQQVEAIQFNGNQLEINTSALSNGVYVLNVQNDLKQTTLKLVVQH